MDETTRLLARHFFRRFLENDLISPDADRHQTLTVAAACLLSFSLVVTMLLAIKYLAALPTPGQVALLSLDDKLLYIGWSMGVMALVTLAEWDTLSLDVRDANILGPLPLSAGRIFAAKAAAVARFAGLALAAINIVPAIVFTSAMVSKLVVGPSAYAALIATHVMVTAAAGAFGFLSVLAIRETIRAAAGPAAFRRISSPLQGALVIVVATALCLLPQFSNRVGRVRLAPPNANAAAAPIWFLGLYETGAGHVMDDLPRSRLPRRLARFDLTATGIYRARKPLFRGLAIRAVAALLTVFAMAATSFGWNNRRLPSPVEPHGHSRHRLREVMVAAVERRFVANPVLRAGFFFSLQTMWRSGPHRLAMAVSVAVGMALTSLAVMGLDAGDAARLVRHRVFTIEPMVLTVVLVGFRHAARVPSELRANWLFRLCWTDHERAYLAGVRRAAFAAVVVPAVLLLFPLHAVLLGVRLATLRTGLGLLLGALGVHLAMLGFRTLPFASSYAPSENAKGWLIALIVAFWPLTQLVGAVEAGATMQLTGTLVYAALLCGAILFCRWLEGRQRKSYGPIEFFDLPAHAQRLDLTA